MAAFIPPLDRFKARNVTTIGLASIFLSLMLVFRGDEQQVFANSNNSEQSGLASRHLSKSGQSHQVHQNFRAWVNQRPNVNLVRETKSGTISPDSHSIVEPDREKTSLAKIARWETKVQRPVRDEATKEKVTSSRSTLNASNSSRSVISDQDIGVKLRALLASPNNKTYLRSKQHETILKQFYSENAYRLNWVAGSGFTWRANVIIGELQKADSYGLKSTEFQIPNLKLSITELARAELILSSSILHYVNHAEGGRLDPRKLSKSIDRGSRFTDPKHILNTITKHGAPNKYLRAFHPKHPQFEALRTKLLPLLHISSRQPEVQRILVNMERWRWLPKSLGQFYLWANIPEFRMRVVKGNKFIHETNIVVGKVSNKTPVFSDKMEYLVFHPYWNVPKSIKAAEIMPHLRRSTKIIGKENLRVRYGGKDINPYQVNWKSVNANQFDFYQPPGRKNVLGALKFMFPNKHSVYMHDTPSRHLFKRQLRLYSHGCMRVQNPEKLAKILLNRDKGWPGSQVDYLIRNGAHQRVDLSRGVPVHITYLTAWVDSHGKLKMYDDYYGHDQLIAEQLFGKSHLILTARYTMTSNIGLSSSTYGSSPRPQASSPRPRRVRSRQENLEQWRRSFLETSD